MLKPLLITGPLVLVLLLSFQDGLTGCTKTETIVDTVTQVRVDTLIQVRVDTLQEQDTPLTAAILTANQWTPLEMRGLVNNTYVYYTRNGSNNTQNFDNEYMSFNADNTGIYHDNLGFESSFTWNFTDASNTKLVWVWNTPSGQITVNWENISYDDGAIRYTEYASSSGTNTLVSEVRIPR